MNINLKKNRLKLLTDGSVPVPVQDCDLVGYYLLIPPYRGSYYTSCQIGIITNIMVPTSRAV